MFAFPPTIRFYLTLSVALLVSVLGAQHDKIAFEKYSVQEGLPEERVLDIIQDDLGYIWAATQNGLIKYDGYNFKVFGGAYSNDDTTNFQFTMITGGLIKGSSGKIWIGSAWNAAIASFDPLTENFTTYYTVKENGQKVEYGICVLLVEDQQKNIWYEYYKTGNAQPILCRLNPKDGSVSYYPHSPGLNIQKWGSVVNAAGTIWLLDKQNHFLKYNTEKDSFENVLQAGSKDATILKDDTIRSLNKGEDDHLLLTGNKGLYIYDTQQEHFTKSYTNNPSNTIISSPSGVNYAKEDSHGNYWLFQEGGHISIIDSRTDKINELQFGKGKLKFADAPDQIYQAYYCGTDHQGVILELFHQEGGRNVSFLHYNFNDGHFRYYDNHFNIESNPLPENGWYTVLIDKSNLLWLGTWPGMYKQAPKKQQFDLYRHQNSSTNSFPSDTIHVLFEDSKNRLWIGTNDGLAFYNSSEDNFTVYQSSSNSNKSLSNNIITAIEEDGDGQIWIGTRNGLNQFDEKTGTFKRHPLNSNKEQRIECIYNDHSNRLWISDSNKGVDVINHKTGSILMSFVWEDSDAESDAFYTITAINEDSRGNIWLCDTRGGQSPALLRYDEGNLDLIHFYPVENDSTSLKTNRISFAVETKEGLVMIITSSGISFYDYEKDAFSNINDPALTSAQSYAFSADGGVWIGSYAGRGLIHLDIENRILTSFGEKEGLLHNDIVNRHNSPHLATDDFGNIWLPTQRGLSVFSPETKTFINFFEKDGFQSYDKAYVLHKTTNGDIWIGGRNGLNRIDPKKLQDKDSSQVSVVITRVTINDSTYSKPDGVIFKESVPYTKEITLSYWQKDLSFEFVGLHFSRSEDNMYAWMLKNYNTTWSEPIKFTAAQPRVATYTNISPGTYTFKVKAANADGVWTEEAASIKITILPPWWKTNWAYLAYVLLFLLGLRLFSKMRERKLQAEKNKLEETVVERTNSLTTTLENLKSTQAQLIQSEKMASLGELTAGIAHEIQNPLNFVNNFSEISGEMIDEMNDEIDKGDIEEVKFIAKDIKINLEKINHHGKRADAIVKGMLQHSRTSSGVKEPTDLNALADEYLRLAYHGFRAKDKSFNATFSLEADPDLPKINVAAQDIGRVLLNLINNAFYAVSTPKSTTSFTHTSTAHFTPKSTDHLAPKSTDFSAPLHPKGGKIYEPTVTVKTRLIKSPFREGHSPQAEDLGDLGAEISVTDNGNGIPKAIKDKIFQPFFTTKPTGQGTGLGLSLAYDIVKAHGGELTVDTIEGKGTTFTIQLPFQIS